jgi:hypothetical protein
MIDTNTWIGVSLALIYVIEKIYMKTKKSKCKCCCVEIEQDMASPSNKQTSSLEISQV